MLVCRLGGHRRGFVPRGPSTMREETADRAGGTLGLAAKARGGATDGSGAAPEGNGSRTEWIEACPGANHGPGAAGGGIDALAGVGVSAVSGSCGCVDWAGYGLGPSTDRRHRWSLNPGRRNNSPTYATLSITESLV